MKHPVLPLRILLMILLILTLIPGCNKDDDERSIIWATYKEKDKKTANLNGCPYWFDILRECFPPIIDGKELDRIKTRNIPASLPWAYYDIHGQQFSPAEHKAPDEFTGYILSFKYAERKDESPLKLMIYYSYPGVKQWLKEIKKGIDIEKYTVGDFTVYHGRLAPGTIKIKWAFLGDCFCVLHRIEDVQYKVTNAERFDKLLGMLDGECILGQVPD